MEITHNEITFYLNCCNEVLRGFQVKPDFDTIFGNEGKEKIEKLELLLNQFKKQDAVLGNITLTRGDILLLIKIIVLTAHVLDWELSLRTNMTKQEVQILINRLSNLQNL